MKRPEFDGVNLGNYVYHLKNYITYLENKLNSVQYAISYDPVNGTDYHSLLGTISKFYEDTPVLKEEYCLVINDDLLLAAGSKRFCEEQLLTLSDRVDNSQITLIENIKERLVWRSNFLFPSVIETFIENTSSKIHITNIETTNYIQKLYNLEPLE